MNLSDISLDIEYVGSWPRPLRGFVILLLCLMVAGFWYFIDIDAQLKQLQTEQAKETELRASFLQEQRKVVNLPQYTQQLQEIERTFGALLRQLPDKTQVPELLVDVSKTGLANGLEFELFKPGTEVIKDFYGELPIEIRVLGSFFDFGGFVSGLSALPRIVTVSNIKIMPNGQREIGVAKSENRFPLVMTALIRTYRYLDEAEMHAPPVEKTHTNAPNEKH